MARILRGGVQPLAVPRPVWWMDGDHLRCTSGTDEYRVKIPMLAVLDQAVNMIQFRIKSKAFAAAY